MCAHCDGPSSEGWCHNCPLSPIKHKHTSENNAQGSVNHRCLVTRHWINRCVKTLMKTHFRQLERFLPVLFAHHQSITFLKTQQMNIFKF